MRITKAQRAEAALMPEPRDGDFHYRAPHKWVANQLNAPVLCGYSAPIAPSTLSRLAYPDIVSATRYTDGVSCLRCRFLLGFVP